MHQFNYTNEDRVRYVPISHIQCFTMKKITFLNPVTGNRTKYIY